MQELGRDPGLVGAAGHSAEEGWQLGLVRELGVLRSVTDLGEEAGLHALVGETLPPLLGVHKCSHLPSWTYPHCSPLCFLLLQVFFLSIQKLCVITIYNLMSLEISLHV